MTGYRLWHRPVYVNPLIGVFRKLPREQTFAELSKHTEPQHDAVRKEDLTVLKLRLTDICWMRSGHQELISAPIATAEVWKIGHVSLWKFWRKSGNRSAVLTSLGFVWFLTKLWTATLTAVYVWRKALKSEKCWLKPEVWILSMLFRAILIHRKVCHTLFQTWELRQVRNLNLPVR